MLLLITGVTPLLSQRLILDGWSRTPVREEDKNNLLGSFLTDQESVETVLPQSQTYNIEDDPVLGEVYSSDPSVRQGRVQTNKFLDHLIFLIKKRYLKLETGKCLELWISEREPAKTDAQDANSVLNGFIVDNSLQSADPEPGPEPDYYTDFEQQQHLVDYVEQLSDESHDTPDYHLYDYQEQVSQQHHDYEDPVPQHHQAEHGHHPHGQLHPPQFHGHHQTHHHQRRNSILHMDCSFYCLFNFIEIRVGTSVTESLEMKNNCI